MTKKMLIDAAHPEETRVVVVDGNRVEEFDFESQNRKQLRGNIYLAKITRVEPSLQAAFVEYDSATGNVTQIQDITPALRGGFVFAGAVSICPTDRTIFVGVDARSIGHIVDDEVVDAPDP